MIVKNNFYVPSRMQLQKRKHNRKKYAWHILVLKQQQAIWNGTKHGYTYKIYIQLEISKLPSSKANGRNGGNVRKHSPVNIVNAYN